MEYKILGCSVEVLYREDGSIIAYQTRVAWQSNLPEFSFLWRCTWESFEHFPTENDIRYTAARGNTLWDMNLAKKLFPYLPGKALSH